MTDTSPIDRCIDSWHEFMLGGGGADVLSTLLHDDCTFISPIVFTPQRGKDVTMLYLTAAGGSLGGSKADSDTPPPKAPDGSEWDGRFHYVREVLDGHDAVLEFETTVDGKYVNGVDMITCDDDALITEIKVMIRPLQAIDTVHAKMKAALESLSAS